MNTFTPSKYCDKRKRTYPMPTYEGMFNASLASNPATEAMWV